MMLKPEKVAKEIVYAINHQQHIRVIDWRYRILTAIWRRIPRFLWRRLKLWCDIHQKVTGKRNFSNGIWTYYPLFSRTFAPVMIVANMNLHEVYADLMGEMNKLDWKRDALLNKAVGVLKRSMEFPASVTYDYQMQSSKNQYIIYFYREHPFAPVLSGYLCVMFDGNKRYVIKWTDKGIPEILILTSHFLQRYKERFLKQPDLSANEVAVRFLSRNRTLRIMPIDERINKRIEEYGEYAGEGFLAQDGFCFKLSGEETVDGKDPVRISFFTTFMPLVEMSDTQREAIFEELMKDIAELGSN